MSLGIIYVKSDGVCDPAHPVHVCACSGLEGSNPVQSGNAADSSDIAIIDGRIKAWDTQYDHHC